LARDSLVFDRDDQCAMPLRVHLWKKILTWVKPTQRHHFAMLSATIECNFLVGVKPESNSRLARKHRFHKVF